MLTADEPQHLPWSEKGFFFTTIDVMNADDVALKPSPERPTR